MAKRKKTKGIRHVAQVLHKYYPKRYTSYTHALPQARIVLAELKHSKQKVTNKNIFAKLNKGRAGGSKMELANLLALPQVQELMKVINYFDIDSVDYTRLIRKLPKKIQLVSKLFPSTVDQPLVGGGDYNYTTLFGPIVAFFDDQRSSAEDTTRYNVDWHVTWTAPVKKKGVFEMEFISVDANGNLMDYGFDPKNVTSAPETPVLSTSEAPEKPATTETPTVPSAGVTSDQEFILQLEKQKEKTAIAKRELVKEMKEAGAPWADIKAELDKL
jgi:hypothetical protein